MLNEKTKEVLSSLESESKEVLQRKIEFIVI